MSKLRKACQRCRRMDVMERSDGLLLNHREPNGDPCEGSRTKPVMVPEHRTRKRFGKFAEWAEE